MRGLPPYALATVLQARDEKLRQGVDVIDLGVGNPDMRPPRIVIEALEAALEDPRVQNHRYPSFNGLPEFRAGVAAWYAKRFGVTLDPAREAMALVGSKEGIFKFFLAHFDPGDTLLLCTPCYPAYIGQAAIAQIRVVEVPLVASRGFLPDLAAIPTVEAQRARAIAVNFPNNPTGGVETAAFYEELLRFARANDLFVISDIAYCDLSLDPGYRARSFLEFDRDRERTIEFHSFSKSYSMQGWRVAFAAGEPGALARMHQLKSNTDYGVFMAIQRAAMAALAGGDAYGAEVSGIYRARRDAFLDAIAPLGFPVTPPRATIYVWLPIPRRFANALEFTRELLDTTGVVVAPGSGFGAAGEGYVRVALCDGEARLREAGARMAKAGLGY
ncbi:MAG: aminotransferase class I/II-fold pyridoxal phosphate-dependent enzyme [Candidatus Eisenbacteria bacterium]|uniref:Aminotransferase n=1 Tax=Eiseniibacteriota bacterium TaxID=2212470 RepID=A0A9D6QJ92_UNCEI|nr:aminotransferase class I/II-fold pyridoxal phosphate-dependent enzyme [Candidatus Eisenbacteria bacterium]MBI3538985.1 aminotransferase class I/II-fold pyridoxal phosphate-dependent enzyme [Candidatus Eisenbacteria bacterium]